MSVIDLNIYVFLEEAEREVWSKAKQGEGTQDRGSCSGIAARRASWGQEVWGGGCGRNYLAGLSPG